MQLHAVKAGLLRIFRGILVIIKQSGDLADVERPRFDIVALAGIGAHAAWCGGRRSGHRLFAVEEIGMDDAAHVPELADDPAAGLMDLFDHRFPGLGLRIVPDTRGKRGAQSLLADPGRFRNDQAGPRALRIIFAHDRGGDMFHGRTAAGEGCHEHAVRGLDGANGDRIK